MENYINSRMPFIQGLAEHGRIGFAGNDLDRARDKTTSLAQKLLFLRAEEITLRHKTLECVNITVKGKVEVFDPSGLEALNSKIELVVSHRQVLEGAITALQEQGITDFLSDLKAASQRAHQTIEDAPRAINHQLGIELTSYHSPDVETAMQSKGYLAVKAHQEERAAKAKAALDGLEPKIKAIEEQITICETALGDSLRVDETEYGSYQAMITRQSTAGMA